MYQSQRGFGWNDVIVNERLPAVLPLVVVADVIIVVAATSVIRTARSSSHVKRIRSATQTHTRTHTAYIFALHSRLCAQQIAIE